MQLCILLKGVRGAGAALIALKSVPARLTQRKRAVHFSSLAILISRQSVTKEQQR